ncbi:MAG: gamma carbonic anhydrase family protein [Pseudomonadota bacterium]
MRYALDGDAPTLEDATVWIADSAMVLGKVTLQTDASVWFGAVLRGDMERITVGARSNIQDCSVLHTDAGFPLNIGADVTVGHRVMLHGCEIGDGALIGIGATVLNGASIGSESLVGAHALVTEGKSFPPGVLIVGSPAKVVRELTADERQALRVSAQHYVANAQRFAAGLTPLDD